MPELTFGLILASFIAGILMFLAPCTLPLVPAYLAFVSGVKVIDVSKSDLKRKILINAFTFVVGFSMVFIVFGVLAGFLGSFVGSFRTILTQLGGLFIILFGLLMLGIFQFSPLMKDIKVPLPSFILPGSPFSAFLIGSIFALGWTPCVGPVLASVLLLAATTTTALTGGFLLLIFSIGLAVPFILTALLFSKANQNIEKYAHISKWVNFIGGLFLVGIGVLLLTDNFGLMLQYGYIVFNYFGFENLFKFY